MNNEIQNSLVARTPTTPSARADITNKTSVETGNQLPPAEEANRPLTAEPPTRAQVEKVAEDLARQASDLGRDLRFELDDDSGLTVIKVIDPLTDEVVRQIPSEEAVERASRGENATLNLINETA